jgi:VWFA-related protein
MLARHSTIKKHCLRSVLCLLMVWSTAAQTPQNPRPAQQDEVVRVYTELVQTDVMVFDKQGHFVNGLRPENFELRIDGKVRPIQSFEQIKAGSDEETQLAAARGTTLDRGGNNSKPATPLDRGRTVFFFVDDFHLDLSGMTATQKLVGNFIDKEMGQNDEAAIISATGQVGFLQQLTDNKFVLRTALKRISPHSNTVRDGDRPTMTEYQAVLISQNDFDVVGYFIDETMKFNPGLPRDAVANIVRNRANALLAQASQITTNTLSGLEGLIRSVKSLPGRKVLFFCSNGFFVENRQSNVVDKLRQIASAAAKAGVVIYSMDVRGLVAPFGDPSVDQFDTSGRLERSTHGELIASQDGLNALARDTGGKAIFNTNDFKPGLVGALKETSVYYLLAWQPEKPGHHTGRFRRIEVSIIGRPDLTVRVRRGFFDSDPVTPTVTATKSKEEDPFKTVARKLHEVLVAPYPDNKLPLSLSVDYHDVAGKGPTLSASVQVPGEFILYGPEGEKIQGLLDVAGAFYDDRGQASSTFYERVITTAPSVESVKVNRPDITYTYPAILKPGLYQARVVVRDYKSGRTGSVRKWIEIPDLSNHQLALSSLLVGEHTQPPITNVSNKREEISPVTLSANHRFRRESSLRFLVFLYNTVLSPSDSKPDAAIQIQVVRDDQPVMTTALKRVSTEGIADLDRIPYAAEMPLADLTSGRYLLVVTVIDRVSKRSASQQTHFDVY